MSQENKDFRIDVEEIVRGKAGNKYKYIPRPAINWLKQILHQDEVNRYLTGRASGKYGMELFHLWISTFEVSTPFPATKAAATIP